MAEFSRLVITEKGSRLVLKTVKHEKKICFTKIATSCDEYSIEELVLLTGLNIRQEVEIAGIEAEDGDTIRLHAVLPNETLEEGYYVQAMGVYADDPDEGEILYGVAVETSKDGCYVPPFQNRTVSSIYFNVSVTVGDSERVDLRVDSGAVVTVKQLDNAVSDLLDRQQSGFETVSQQIEAVKEQIRANAEKDAETNEKINIFRGDVQDLISGLTKRLNALADSDDTTLDQLSEIVAYIKNNKSLIDSITTSKVSVSDIVDNLTSTVANKPLSGNQGRILKELITALTSTVDTKVDKVSGKGLSTNDYTTGEKDKLKNIESGAEVNVQADWNETNTGNDAFIKNKPTKLSQFDNDSGFKTTDTTYSVVSKTANGLAPKLPNETTTAKYLRQDGTWAVPPDNNTTYSTMTAATASAAGKAGLVPAPAKGAQNNYLTGGGTFQNVDDHAAAFTSADVADGSATAWTTVTKLTSGEPHKTIFNKISTMFKNIRYLYKMLGTTDISAIGNGTVTGALRSLNTNIAYKNITNQLPAET
ncbi:MAG: hypothetical protein NC249_10150, partial [Lachnoclostridium sp.]|nr:hypothetical protein [Lachnoclostridium sp.]